VQRAVDVDEMTAAGAPEPTTQPATAAAPHPAPATANIEDLARRLYDPLAARLKAELRLDRERFGLVTDLYR
jgi:tRNA A37 threonylcarbamoyladenosine dehydratase